MGEETPARRSFRLKDKPAPEYAYKDYLKKDWLPPAVIKANQKYDDIFTSVVTNAFLMDIQMTPDEYYAEKRARMPPPSPEKPKKSRGPRGPYKKRPKPQETPITLDSRLTKIQNQIRSISGSSPRKGKGAGESIQKIQKITKNLVKIVKKIEENDSGSSDIEVLPTPKKVFPCSCGKEYDEHEECHRHLFEEHYDHEELADCIQCGHRLDDVRTHHVCHICHKFAADLEKHLRIHYQNCTSERSVMECRFCTRQFKTVKEVVAHECEKHVGKSVRHLPYIYRCNACPAVFNTQDSLLAHYSNHIDVNALGDKIDELQSRVNAGHGECPFCRCRRTSRKAFRSHLLKDHWIACKSISRMNLNEIRSDREIKQEIGEIVKSAAEIEEKKKKKDQEVLLKEVKQEVKEEIHDDGYPSC